MKGATHSDLFRDVWERMERRLKGLPRPPRSGTEQPNWAIPSDGLPRIRDGRVTMKIVRSYPSGWNGYPVHAVADLSALRFSILTIDDALFSSLRARIDGTQ